jgi:hypothetical protein
LELAQNPPKSPFAKGGPPSRPETGKELAPGCTRLPSAKGF